MTKKEIVLVSKDAIHTLSTLVITREYLISLLRAWQHNKISVLDIYSTASQLHFVDDMILLDWEENESFSVTMEMLNYLESLEINFVTQEDIEHAIEFLHAKIGSFNEGWQKWQQYKSSINYKERIKRLNGIHPYIYDERYPKAKKLVIVQNKI